MRFVISLAETVILSKHLALQVTTTFAWGRSAQRHLVPVGSVRDIIINEVFYNVSGIYWVVLYEIILFCCCSCR